MEIKNESREEMAKQVYAYVTDLMIMEHRSKEEIIKILTDAGAAKERAMAIVGEVEQQIAKKKKKEALKYMLIGASVCVVGIIIIIASDGHDISWGTMLTGFLLFIVGLVNLSKG